MNPDPITGNTSITPLMREQERLKDAKGYTYKVSDKVELKAYAFFPENHSKEEPLPVAVFFHGGLWDKPMVSQFVPHAMHLVAYRSVAILVEYRISSLHGTTPVAAVEDAQSAILWIKENHSFLGIDPQKISAWGAGSGAHLALCAAMNKEVVNNGLLDSRPHYLVLFSSIIDTSKNGVGLEQFASKKEALTHSPLRHIRKGLPPIICCHGTSDTTTPIIDVEKFCKKIRSKKNTCLFYPINKGSHSFFNFNVSHQHFIQSLDQAIAFLRAQGFLDKTIEPML